MELTVIIPVYNSSQTIIECIDSVVDECSANPLDWEIILVDDGSKDDSAEIINSYVASSPYACRIKLIRQRNGGAASARNAGLQAAKGELIAFNDSDDKWLPGKMKMQRDYLADHTDVVMIAGVFGQDRIAAVKKIDTDTEITIRDQLFKNYFSPPATTIRRSVLTKSGLFNERMRYAEDGYFFNNVVVAGISVVVPIAVTVPINDKARWGDSGLSGNLVAMEKGELYNIASARRFRYVSFPIFAAAYCFSLIKFVRRYIISIIRKVWR